MYTFSPFTSFLLRGMMPLFYANPAICTLLLLKENNSVGLWNIYPIYMEHEKRPICTAWYKDIKVRGNHLDTITALNGVSRFYMID